MSVKYEIEMKKDEKVLEDFILFTYRANAPGRTGVMALPALGLMLIGYMEWKDRTPVGIAILLFGFVWLLFVCFRHKIALRSLKRVDEAYKNKMKLVYKLRGNYIYVSKNDEAEEIMGSYSQISCFYEDEDNFYIGINNEELCLFPKSCFVSGDLEAFVAYIEKKSGEQCEFLPRKMKNKWMMLRIKAKKKEEEYDERVKERREKLKKGYDKK